VDAPLRREAEEDPLVRDIESNTIFPCKDRSTDPDERTDSRQRARRPFSAPRHEAMPPDACANAQAGFDSKNKGATAFGADARLHDVAGRVGWTQGARTPCPKLVLRNPRVFYVFFLVVQKSTGVQRRVLTESTAKTTSGQICQH